MRIKWREGQMEQDQCVKGKVGGNEEGLMEENRGSAAVLTQ